MVLPWMLRALWLSLPFLAGPVFGDALATTSRAVQLTATVGLWVSWAVGLAVSLIPLTVTLTPMRIIVPAAFAATMWAAIDDGVSGWTPAALTVTAAAALVALSPQIGAFFVNGSSYGDERRVPLRPPAQLLLGPVPLAWLVSVAGVVAGPLLLAARQWAEGAVALLVGLAAAWFAVRALHGLARRWLVFVPAGLVVHDHLGVADPVLFKRSAIRSLGPALTGTDAVDLTVGALGQALELRTTAPVEIAYRPAIGQEPEVRELSAVLLAPSLPGAVLAEARGRRITVG